MLQGSIVISSSEKLYARVVVPSGLVKNLFSNPQEILPAPGVGKFIDPTDMVCRLIFSGGAYLTNTTLELFFTGAATGFATCGNLINRTSDSITKFTVTGNAGQILKENTAMKLRIQNGDPTNVPPAGGGLVLYIEYRIITL